MFTQEVDHSAFLKNFKSHSFSPSNHGLPEFLANRLAKIDIFNSRILIKSLHSLLCNLYFFPADSIGVD